MHYSISNIHTKALWLFLVLFFANLGRAQDLFDFKTFPDIPDATGVAGPYVGTDQGTLMVAGGANFPQALPWKGGTKVYHDAIYLMAGSATGEYHWITADKKLPAPLGYGGTASGSQGMYLFGGKNDAGSTAESWWIKLGGQDKTLEISNGSQLPEPMAEFAYCVFGDYVYLMGGTNSAGASSNAFWRFPLNKITGGEQTWEKLNDIPGPARSFAVATVQNNGVDNCIYLFSGRTVKADGSFELLKDGLVYNPRLKQWSFLDTAQSFPLMAGTIFPLGASSIVFPSSADGEMITREKEMKGQLLVAQTAGDTARVRELEAMLLDHLEKHPGFKKNVRIYNTITHEIAVEAQLPATGQVTTSAVWWEGGYVIPSGEIRPGVRTPSVFQIIPKANKQTLSMTDLIVIILYFGVLAYMGYYFSKRQNDVEDYFKGGSRVPWWAAGLSIFGTALSAITFMAIPAKTFSTDWSYFMLNMTIFLVAPIIIMLFIPFYRRLNMTTAYEYLEERFNLTVRLLGSASFILYQIGRMGVVLFLPSIALNVVTDIDIFTCIILMGVISMVYTMMGGIEAVIWTDVVQVIVLMGGAILCMVLILWRIDGGFTEVISLAQQNNKFNVLDLSLSLKEPTVWAMLIGGVFANITTYGTDQTMVQRYLTTKTEKMANKSVWTNAILTIPATLIFFFLGTALFAFFKKYPSDLNPALTNNDALLPWYISSQLPKGISGLLIAGIFAAAMSSLSSSINSAAAAYVTDFHARFGWTPKTSRLKTAKIASVVVGTAGVLFAILMATWDIKSLWDEFQKVLGLIIGGLGGVFLLGILSKHATSYGALVGIVFSVIVQILVAYYQPVHLMVYSATGVISCFGAGWIASYFIGTPPTDLKLTYFGNKEK